MEQQEQVKRRVSPLLLVREVTSRVPSRDESSDSDLLTSEQFSSPRDSLVYS